MAILKERRSARTWWYIFFIVIASGVGFALIVYSRWDTLAELAGANEKEEYTEKDLMQCGPGTHQEGSKCVANKTPSGPAAPSPQ